MHPSFSNYAKVTSRQGTTSQRGHGTSDRKSRSQDQQSEEEDEAESGSKSVILSERSSTKVSSDCNICSSGCSDCSDEIEADLDPGMWNGRLSVSWQSLDKGT